MTKHLITKKIIAYQAVAYGILLLLIVGDEAFDLPHHIFGAQPTPINWVEAVIEAAYILVLGAAGIFLSWLFFRQIKYLEGFLPVCSFCKKIRVGENWIMIEQYIREHSAAEFSHSLCPDCLEKHYSGFKKTES